MPAKHHMQYIPCNEFSFLHSIWVSLIGRWLSSEDCWRTISQLHQSSKSAEEQSRSCLGVPSYNGNTELRRTLTRLSRRATPSAGEVVRKSHLRLPLTSRLLQSTIKEDEAIAYVCTSCLFRFVIRGVVALRTMLGHGYRWDVVQEATFREIVDSAFLLDLSTIE